MSADKPTAIEKELAAEVSRLKGLLTSTELERQRFQRDLVSSDERLRNSEERRSGLEQAERARMESKAKERKMVIVLTNGETMVVKFTEYIRRGDHRFLQLNGSWLSINPANVNYMDEIKMNDEAPDSLEIAANMKPRPAEEVVISHDIAYALEMMKQGKKVSRANWNRHDLKLGLQRRDDESVNTEPYVYLLIPGPDGETYRVPWTCSQTDLLAHDWDVVE